MRPLLKFVSLRHLLRRRGRTALTTFGITLGVAMVMAVFSLNGTINDAYTKLFSGLAGIAEVEIAALSAAGIDEDILETAAQTEGIAAAAPAIKGNTVIFTVPPPSSAPLQTTDQATGQTADQASVFLLGVRPDEDEFAVRTYVLNSGRLLGPKDDRSVLLTESLATRLGIGPGDEVDLLTVAGKQRFEVVGLIGAAGPGAVNAGQLVVVPLEQAQRVLGKQGRIDQVGLVLTSGADKADVEQSLRDAFGAGAHVGKPTTGRAVEDVLGSLNLMLTFAGAISLFAAFFLMYNNVSMAIAERRHEYGILMSLGTTGRNIMGSVITETALLSLAGGGLGVVLGVAVADVMVQALGDTLAGALRLGVTGAAANPGAVITAMGAGLVASTAAALGPARDATRIAPTDVLRSGPATFPSRRRRLGPGVLLIGLGAAVTVTLLLYGNPGNFNVFVWPLFAAMLLSLVGVVMALQSVVHRLPQLFKAPFRKLLGVPGYLAAGNLGRWPARTGTTVGALLVALSMLVGVTALTQSYRTYLHRWVELDTDWDLLVSSSWLGLGAETPLQEGFRGQVEAVEGVALASPERFVFVDYGDGRVYMSVFDMNEFGRFATFNVAEGPPSDEVIAALAAGDAVAVSRPFAMVHEVRVGDIIELPAPSGNYPVKLAAVVDDMSLAGGTMYIHRDLYKRLWQDESVDAFAVKVEPGADVDVVRQAILDAFADGVAVPQAMTPGAAAAGTAAGTPPRAIDTAPEAIVGAAIVEVPLTVQTSREFAEDLDQMVTESFSLIQALVLVSLLVAGLGIANTLVMTVLERRRELAELRALGATKAHIRRLVLGEALGAGLLGTVLGAAVGVVMAVAMVEANRRFIGLAYPLVMPPSIVAMTAGIGLVLAPAAGWIPARIAARLPIVDGMRTE